MDKDIRKLARLEPHLQGQTALRLNAAPRPEVWELTPRLEVWELTPRPEVWELTPRPEVWELNGE